MSYFEIIIFLFNFLKTLQLISDFLKKVVSHLRTINQIDLHSLHGILNTTISSKVQKLPFGRGQRAKFALC